MRSRSFARISGLALSLSLSRTRTASSFAPPSSTSSSSQHPRRSSQSHFEPTTTIRLPTERCIFGNTKKSSSFSEYDRDDPPEGKPATYDLLPSEFGFSPANIVRPLLKQTQLQSRKLQVVYDAKRDGWDGRSFHSKVDGRGASVVLVKIRGRWVGGYNPRGWASLGGARSSVASFLFYQKFPFGGWQKLRVSRSGSMACGRDEYDAGVYFGSDALVIPLNAQRGRPKSVTSRLGYFFECGPEDRSTLLPVKGADANAEELYVISGVYAKGEDIPNSGGVSELGFY